MRKKDSKSGSLGLPEKVGSSIVKLLRVFIAGEIWVDGSESRDYVVTNKK